MSLRSYGYDEETEDLAAWLRDVGRLEPRCRSGPRDRQPPRGAARRLPVGRHRCRHRARRAPLVFRRGRRGCRGCRGRRGDRHRVRRAAPGPARMRCAPTRSRWGRSVAAGETAGPDEPEGAESEGQLGDGHLNAVTCSSVDCVREVTRAHDRTARPQRPGSKQSKTKTPALKGAPSGGACARASSRPLRRSRTPRCARWPECGSRAVIEVSAYIPGVGPQPAGALHRARARRPGEGPARRALQGHPRRARRSRRARAKPGPFALRRQEGVLSDAAQRPRHTPRARPDPVYRSVLVTQVVNKVLSRGKRSLAERVVYDALDDRAREVRDRPGADFEEGRGERPAPSSR